MPPGRPPKHQRNPHYEQALRDAAAAHDATRATLHATLARAVANDVPIARAARLAGIARGTAYRILNQL